jgi:GH25 family lysozyme M1 (1,4-beta-N-acetylmuramidase)
VSVFEFVLRLVGILIPAVQRKRAEDSAERERPLIDVAAEVAAPALYSRGGPDSGGDVDVVAEESNRMLLGVDVWNGYGKIDWVKAKAAGVRFVIAKCTQGNDGKDSRFDEYVAGAKAAGIPVGAYLYGYALPTVVGKSGRSPAAQAAALYEDSGGLGSNPGELPPVLDMEFPARWDRRKLDSNGALIDQWQRWGITGPEFIARWTLACLAEMERLFGRTPILYTYPDFWARLGAFGKLPEFKRYPLWIASYPKSAASQPLPDPASKPLVPGPWSDFAIWQFSADGSPVKVPGIPACPLDRNVIKDENTLAKLLA